MAGNIFHNVLMNVSAKQIFSQHFLIFQQKVFRDYIIKTGLFDYWKNTQFPTGCRAVSNDDFICE